MRAITFLAALTLIPRGVRPGAGSTTELLAYHCGRYYLRRLTALWRTEHRDAEHRPARRPGADLRSGVSVDRYVQSLPHGAVHGPVPVAERIELESLGCTNRNSVGSPLSERSRLSCRPFREEAREPSGVIWFRERPGRAAPARGDSRSKVRHERDSRIHEPRPGLTVLPRHCFPRGARPLDGWPPRTNRH